MQIKLTIVTTMFFLPRTRKPNKKITLNIEATRTRGFATVLPNDLKSVYRKK